MKELSKEQFKERAKFLREILKEKHKIELPHGHALEVLSKVLGFKDWNTASALSSNNTSETRATANSVVNTNKELPIAIKLQTAGDFIDFFSKIDRNKKVFFNEYKETDLGHLGTLTSICSATYDYEIQNDLDVRLELNTEDEKNLQLQDFGKSSTQKFEPTKLGRIQRVIKFFNVQGGFWSPTHFSKAERM